MKNGVLKRLGMSGPGDLQRLWAVLSRMPGGRRVMSRLVGEAAPYTGTIRAEILELRPGYARLAMRDRRAVRNHLDCVHAIALMNLAEETSGLATMMALPPGARGIISGLSIDYAKKARGRLEAECHTEVAAPQARTEHQVQVAIRDGKGDVVATATARWVIEPARS
ncbi:MAG: hotdog fold domain-containing protein [Myxococcota bacterium]